MTPIDEVLADDLTAMTFFGRNRKRARNKYMRYMRLVHPDMVDDSRSSTATARLNVLWENYQSTVDGTTGKPSESHGSKDSHHRVNRIVDTATMSIMVDLQDKSWLMVNRVANATLQVDDTVSAMVDRVINITSGSPVRVFPIGDQMVIPQHDGSHMAYRTPTDVFNGVYGLSSLLESCISKNILNSRDVAWIFKRLLFLTGALDEVGLSIDDPSAFLSRLLVSPENHTVIMVDWTGLSVKDGDNVMGVSKAFSDIIRHHVDHAVDVFIRGCGVSHKPSAGELMRDFDDVLLDEYGAPSFHRMELPDD
jgi:hypothetical protein